MSDVEEEKGTATAAATAQVGDNDTAATDHLKARVAAVDIMVPRIERSTGDRPMCWSWQDHGTTS